MRAREAMLAARGQIVFILALAVSLGAIVWLETISTGQHLLERSESGPASAIVVGVPPERAVTVLSEAEEAYRASPDAPELQAALLVALAIAHDAGACTREACLREAQALAAARDDWWNNPVLAPAMLLAVSIFPALREVEPQASGGS